MDPDACLWRIARADHGEVAEACEDLHRWISMGGFQPQWAACPDGTRRYQAWLHGRDE